jgi:integron integrase
MDSWMNEQYTGTEASAPVAQAPKLLEQLRNKVRLKHYSIRTEHVYVDWARRFILFHNKRHPKQMGAPEVAAFLTHLAVERHVSASTQNQAKSALLFLYKHVLAIDLPWLDDVESAKPSRRLPVVLTPREGRLLLNELSGTMGLIVSLLYGTGMRLLEGLRLRVKDIEFERREVIVRDGKGGKDRVTVLPENLILPLQQQLAVAKRLHQQDLADGFGEVWLPNALALKYRNAAKAWGWQYVSPRRCGRAIRAAARSGAIISIRNRCSAPCAKRRGARASQSPCHRTCCGIRLPRTCCRRATTSVRCRNCSATRISTPR